MHSLYSKSKFPNPPFKSGRTPTKYKRQNKCCTNQGYLVIFIVYFTKIPVEF